MKDKPASLWSGSIEDRLEAAHDYIDELRTALRAKEQECGRLRAFVQAIADGGNLGKPVPEGVRYSAECLLKTSDAALRPPAEGEEE